MKRRLRVLFVCGRNRRRSPTAARVFRNDRRVSVRAVGVSPQARRELSERDLDWADLVLVMERKHASRIRATFGGRDRFPPIETLDIPDEFEFMDEQLVALIRVGTEPYLEASGAGKALLDGAW